MTTLEITDKIIESLYFSAVRKKPVVVQAVQINEPFEIDTLEGTVRGNAGDYMIKGVKGELYPIRKDIFEETYEYMDNDEE